MSSNSVMLMVEPQDTKLLIDSLMLLHVKDPENCSTKTILSHIITHGRVPYCKRIAPDAYDLCFPDGPDYAEELASDRFRTGRAFMVMIEEHEIDVLIAALLLMREHDAEEGWSEDHRIKPLLKRIMYVAGLPYSKKYYPEVYNLCFPDGPPRIVGTYGKYNQ